MKQSNFKGKRPFLTDYVIIEPFVKQLILDFSFIRYCALTNAKTVYDLKESFINVCEQIYHMIPSDVDKFLFVRHHINNVINENKLYLDGVVRVFLLSNVRECINERYIDYDAITNASFGVFGEDENNIYEAIATNDLSYIENFLKKWSRKNW